MFVSRFFAFASVGVALILGNPLPASAAGTQLTICNQSTALIQTAVGYHSMGVNDQPGSNVLTGPFVSTGWWRINPGACTTYNNPFNARYMFWWAVNHVGLNEHGTVWNTNGNDHFCIPDVYGVGGSNGFTFEDENVSEAACEKGHWARSGAANLWVTVRSVDLLVNPSVSFVGD